jgi:hypothetical protein
MAALAGGGEGNDTIIVQLTENGLQKCTFTGTVGADEGDQLAAMDMQIDFVQNGLLTDTDTQILHPKAAGVAAVTAVNIKVHPNASFTVSILR